MVGGTVVVVGAAVVVVVGAAVVVVVGAAVVVVVVEVVVVEVVDDVVGATVVVVEVAGSVVVVDVVVVVEVVVALVVVVSSASDELQPAAIRASPTTATATLVERRLAERVEIRGEAVIREGREPTRPSPKGRSADHAPVLPDRQWEEDREDRGDPQ